MKQRKIELILGTVKSESESWENVFTRIGKAGGIDLKTVSYVLAFLLDQISEFQSNEEIMSQLELLKRVQVRNSEALDKLLQKPKPKK